jgi:ribosomal protein S6
MKAMSDKENNVDIEAVDDRIYEVGYILLPTLGDENVPVEYGNLKELIASLGGEVIADDMPRITPLAYTMVKVIQNIRNKFDTGYFGWVKFSMEPSKVLELKKKLDLNTKVLRHLIMKTVKENTIAAKRYVHRDTRRAPSAKKEGDTEALPINKEEIDKEIDALIEA